MNFGTSTSEFLKIKPEAAPAGMGETSIAVADGTNALVYNPAGLALLDRSEISGTELLWFNNIHMEYAAYVMPFEKGFGAGLNLFWIDFGSFDSTGGIAPAVEVQNGFASFGIGKSFSSLFAAGADVKATYENFLGDKSFGFSSDIGALLTIAPRVFSLGFTARNLGVAFGTPDLLPMEVGLGASLRFFSGKFDYANLAFDASKILLTDNVFFGVGFEYYLLRLIALRAGVRYNNALDIDELTLTNIQKMVIFSGGLGLSIGDSFMLDYSYTPMGDIGVVSRITLKALFGESIYEQELAEKNAKFEPKAMEVPEVKTEGGQIQAVTFKPGMPQEKVKEWTLAIKTSDGKIVKTFTGVGEIPKDLSWDGTDSFGKIGTSDVNYVYDFKVKDIKGQVIKTIGKIQKVPEFDFLEEENKRYIPIKGEEMLVAPVTLLVSSDTEERKQVPFVMVNKEIKQVKNWEFVIYDKAGVAVKRFADKGSIPSYLVWDGKDTGGKYVDDLKSCKYVLNVTGVDGSEAKIKDRTVVTNPFVITSKVKKLKLAKKIFFKENSFIIEPELEERVIEIAEDIKAHKNVQVFIQGHASVDETNPLELSQERAKMVLRYLVEKYRVSPLSITTVGYGADVPAAENDSQDNRMRNRRVEILIMGEKTVR